MHTFQIYLNSRKFKFFAIKRQIHLQNLRCITAVPNQVLNLAYTHTHHRVAEASTDILYFQRPNKVMFPYHVMWSLLSEVLHLHAADKSCSSCTAGITFNLLLISNCAAWCIIQVQCILSRTEKKGIKADIKSVLQHLLPKSISSIGQVFIIN